MEKEEQARDKRAPGGGDSQRESTVADALGLGGGKWASDHPSLQHLAV